MTQMSSPPSHAAAPPAIEKAGRFVNRHVRPDRSAGAVAYLQLVTFPSAPFWARCQVRAVLCEWQADPEMITTAELLASELVTNAVKFGSPPSGGCRYSDLAGVEVISLTLRRIPGQVVIEVSDPDPQPPVLIEAGPDAESGRGLMLVQALSKEWNYYFPPAGGKTVFCVIGESDSSHVPGRSLT